jgi:hypothetical protein
MQTQVSRAVHTATFEQTTTLYIRAKFQTFHRPLQILKIAIEAFRLLSGTAE